MTRGAARPERPGGRHDQPGTRVSGTRSAPSSKELSMNRIVYIVGLIVIVLVVLSFLGLR